MANRAGRNQERERRNSSQTCRRYMIAQALYHRRKDEAELGARATGPRGIARAAREKDLRYQQLERTCTHREVANRTPHDVFLAFAQLLKNEAPAVKIGGLSYTISPSR
jgi:hypothetical protein